MNDSLKLIDLIKTKEKLVAMLAPSFPIMYEYPQIICRLRALGVTYTVEVSVGAKITNKAVIEILLDNPQRRIIASPCPSFVQLIKTKHPQLLRFLALEVDSPMVATAKIVKEKYPGFKPVFIGPCIAKKIEATVYHPELNLLVITYKELEEVFKYFKTDENSCPNQTFDLTEESTRIYPLDGGLTHSGGLNKILKDDELKIVSGWKNIEAALTEFENNPRIRFMDVLFCEEGCINGPGIISGLDTGQRKEKILEYYHKL